MRALLIVLLLTSCVSSEKHDADARALAHRTLQQAVILKREIARKVAAERQFYRDAEKTLTDEERRRMRQEEVREAVIVAESVRNEALVDPASITAEYLAGKLHTSTETTLERAKSESNKRQAKLKAQLESLQHLGDLQAEVAGLERVLLELSQKPTRNDAATAVEFILRAREHYERLQGRGQDDAEGTNER